MVSLGRAGISRRDVSATALSFKRPSLTLLRLHSRRLSRAACVQSEVCLSMTKRRESSEYRLKGLKAAGLRLGLVQVQVTSFGLNVLIWFRFHLAVGLDQHGTYI